MGVDAMSSDQRDVYDRVQYATAPTGDAAATFAPSFPASRALILQHFPKDLSAAVLELGCGAGRLLHAAQELGYRNVRGVDVSAEQVSTAARLGVRGVSQGDALTEIAGQAPASLDVVVCWDLLEHLAMEPLLALPPLVFRALKPGGVWLIHVPNGTSPFVGRVLFGDITHYRAFTPESMRQLLAPSFAQLSFFEDVPVVHGVRSAARRVLWQAARSAAQLWLAVESGTTSNLLSQNFLTVAKK